MTRTILIASAALLAVAPNAQSAAEAVASDVADSLTTALSNTFGGAYCAPRLEARTIQCALDIPESAVDAVLRQSVSSVGAVTSRLAGWTLTLVTPDDYVASLPFAVTIEGAMKDIPQLRAAIQDAESAIAEMETILAESRADVAKLKAELAEAETQAHPSMQAE